MDDRVEIICVDSHHIVATFRSVALVVWRDETRAESIRQVAGVLERLASQVQGAGIGLIQVIEDGCRPLDAEGRQALDRLFFSARHQVRCSSVLFEGEGFKAAIVRGVVAGIALITRTHFPHRVFARPEDMASFMARGLTGTLDRALAARLHQALREARESAESRLPSTRPRPFNSPLSDVLPRR